MGAPALQDNAGDLLGLAVEVGDDPARVDADDALAHDFGYGVEQLAFHIGGLLSGVKVLSL